MNEIASQEEASAMILNLDDNIDDDDDISTTIIKPDGHKNYALLKSF